MKQLSSNSPQHQTNQRRNLSLRFSFRAAGGQIKRDYEYRLFEGGRFDEKGFLIKSFPLHTVVSLIETPLRDSLI